jgi:hypothetical protein
VRLDLELTELGRTDSMELRQDRCLAKRNEGRARKDGSQDGRQPKGNERRSRTSEKKKLRPPKKRTKRK